MEIGSRQNVANPYAANRASAWLSNTKSVRTPSDRLLLLFPTQTEIEAKYWFKRFHFALLELSDAW